MIAKIESNNSAKKGDVSKDVLNVTDLSQYAFCPRQFFLSKVLGLRRQPPEFVEGSLEHDVRRLLNGVLRPAYVKCGPNRQKLWLAANAIVGKTLEYAGKIALLQHPIFTKEINKFTDELRFRLLLEEKQRVHLLTGAATDESRWAEQVKASFPFECELSVFSQELRLRGRIDEVYDTEDGGLVVRDIKTATVGYPFDEANQVQLGAYALLLENQTSRKVAWAAVYSSRNLAERRVLIDDDLHKRVLETDQQVREFLENPELPHMLTGPEAVKCAVCFLRDDCFRLGEGGSNKPTGIEALFGSEGKLSLYGED